MSIIFPIPYTLVLYALGSSLDPILLSISSGLGSALGELSGYIIGYYGRAIISEDMKRKMDFMLKVFSQYGQIAIFLFALTPLPDDLLFIPLGIARFSLTKALISCFLGKILMSFIIAYSGRVSFEFVKIIFGEGGWLGAAIIVIVLLIVIVVIFKFDWEKFFKERFMGKESNGID
ncbi:MAG: VTT domain-containing protein [Candidatus Bathyarchaeota archaeon]|nr:MAG: VTT domain-containing protein [Candidatus Bathyarchaeota archaeon]